MMPSSVVAAVQETPAPTWSLEHDSLVTLAIVLTLWLLLILGSGFLVLSASKYPPPLALVMVLSIVTLVCIAAFVVSRDQVILQLASVGLGALAAAVATTWGAVSKRYEEESLRLKEKIQNLEKKVEPTESDGEDDV